MNSAELLNFQIDGLHRVDINGSTMKPGDVVIKPNYSTKFLEPFMYFGKIDVTEFKKTRNMFLDKKQLFLGANSFQLENENFNQIYILPDKIKRQIFEEYDECERILMTFIRKFNLSMTLKFMMKLERGKNLHLAIVDQEDVRFDEDDGWAQVPDTRLIDLNGCHVLTVPVYNEGGYATNPEIIYSRIGNDDYEFKISRRKLNSIEREMKHSIAKPQDLKKFYVAWMFMKNGTKEISIDACGKQGYEFLRSVYDIFIK